MKKILLTLIFTFEKVNAADNSHKVPLSKGIYPGLITTKIPMNPTIKAVILCILITSPKNIIARIVVKSGVVNPIAAAFSNCIVPIAVNQLIIE